MAPAPIKINPHLLGYQNDSYTSADPDHPGALGLLDCSLGVNPYGTSPLVRSDDGIAPELLTSYPIPSIELRDDIAAHWSAVADLAPETIHLEAGAFGVIERINKLMVRPGDVVLGYCPQFPDYAHDAMRCGGTFEHVPLDTGTGCRFDEQPLVDAIRFDHTLVYIDNPNNPTGQIIALDRIERIVHTARTRGVGVLVDEAYGDYMPPENSAIRLVNDYDNLFVARSFSKGWGLGGFRVGYVVMSGALVPSWRKIAHPFPVNALGQLLARRALQDSGFLADCIERTRHATKEIEAGRGELRLLESSPSVPIMTLVHPDPDFDLFAEFRRRGVLTSAGTHFTGLGRNGVRIRVPSETARLVSALEEIGSGN